MASSVHSSTARPCVNVSFDYIRAYLGTFPSHNSFLRHQDVGCTSHLWTVKTSHSVKLRLTTGSHSFCGRNRLQTIQKNLHQFLIIETLKSGMERRDLHFLS